MAWIRRIGPLGLGGATEEAAEGRRRDNLQPRVGPEALRKVDPYRRPEHPTRSLQLSIPTHNPAIKRRHVAAYEASASE